MSKKAKYTKEEMNAMRINAMLQGIDPSTLFNEEEEEDEIEIEIVEDVEEKPKKKKKSSSQEVRVGSENQVFTTTQSFIEERDEFKRLPKSLEVRVNFNEHDIHYKEQFWNIPRRAVVYNVELVKNPKVAADISNIMNNNSVPEKDKARQGLVRYYKVVTYENVLSRLREIAYVKVINNNGKLTYQIKVLNQLLKECKANPENVKKAIVNVVKENIK